MKILISKKAVVIVDFDIDAENVFLTIKNLGAVPALKLRIKPLSAILGFEGKKDISKLSVFKEISYLAPLKEIKIFVDSYESFFTHLKDTSVHFRISYKNEKRRSFKMKIHHDLRIYADLIYFIRKF
jgi:hypothetical protein